jgi:hypothetical protein
MNNVINKLYTKGAEGIRVSRETGFDRRDMEEFRAVKWSDREFLDALGVEKAKLDAANAINAQRFAAVGGPRTRGGSGAAYGRNPGRGIAGVGGVSYGGGGGGYAQVSNGGCAPLSPAEAQAAAAAATRLANMDPGCLRGADPSCLEECPCHADLLGFTTLEEPIAAFPIVGVAGLSAPQSINLAPQTTNFYKPAFLFVEARDATNAFAFFPGLITNATINRVQQLSSSGYAGGISTSAFSVDTPLDVRKFAMFGSNVNDQLVLQFGNFGGVGIDLHYFGIFWGDNAPCR